METGSRNIPSLDGLRAISVLMVVAAHMNGPWVGLIPYVPFWLYLAWGALGVQTFFVISGFLITHLLLKELNATGDDKPEEVLCSPGSSAFFRLSMSIWQSSWL